MNIGLKIKQLMVQEKLEISDLAKKLGKSKQAIYDILEKEDVNTSLLRDLSSVFNVPITIFFDDCSSTQNSTGNSNVLVGGDNHGSISTAECQDKLDDAFLEIKHLKERLKDKEEMIVLMKGLLKSNNDPSDAG